MATDVSLIRSVDWSPAVGDIGAIVEALEDVSQCIEIIVATPKGSDPHRPTFGCDAWQYLDRPVNIAGPQMIQAVIDAIEAWEPRAAITKVVPSAEMEQVTLAIYWTLAGDQTGAEYLTEATLGGTV